MSGQQDIFLQYFEPVKNNLWRFCLSLSKNSNDAKDLLQDTIESAYRNFNNIQHKEAFLSYLFTIASRLFQNNNKEEQKFIEQDNDYYFENLSSNDTPIDVKADITNLYEALDILPFEQKEAIILFDIIGFSRPEICEIQGVSLDALKARLYRGRKKLAEILGVYDDFEIENRFINVERN